MRQIAPQIVSRNESQVFVVHHQASYWLVAIVLCLLPLERTTLPYDLRMVDISLIILVVFSIFNLLSSKQRIYFPLVGPFWLILVASLIASFSGVALFASLVAIFQEIYLFIWFVVLTNVLIHLSFYEIDKLLKLWSIVALIEATATIMGMLHVGPEMFYTLPGETENISNVSRGIGTYGNSNAAGAYLSISFFIVLMTSWPVAWRALVGTGLLAGIIATGSLGAIISTGVGIVILTVAYLILIKKSSPMLVVALLTMGASFLMLGLLVASPINLVSMAIDSFSQDRDLLSLTIGRFPRSFESRLNLIKNTLPIFERFPLGTGPNSAVTFGGSLHNDFIAYFFERGPLGAIGWIWLMVVTILTPFKVAKMKIHIWQRWHLINLGAASILCVLFSITHEISHFRQFWFLLAFIFALSHLYSSIISSGRLASRHS